MNLAARALCRACVQGHDSLHVDSCLANNAQSSRTKRMLYRGGAALGTQRGQALGIVTFSFPVVLMNQARSG